MLPARRRRSQGLALSEPNARGELFLPRRLLECVAIWEPFGIRKGIEPHLYLNGKRYTA